MTQRLSHQASARVGRVSASAMIWTLCGTIVATSPSLANWPMKQRDAHNTGRADYIVPPERMNDTFFDVFLWQKRAPSSPGEGNLSSTSMVFFDGVGPNGGDIVVGGYHWPKGVQGMDRHTGGLFWAGNPGGGESIGTNSAAFANNGGTLYVTNDSTDSSQYPKGHPLMAFAAATGPSLYRHNGADTEPGHMGTYSPKIAPDGRIFLHSWVDRPYAASDNGSVLHEVWAADTPCDCGLSDPALYNDGGQLKVIIGARWGAVFAYDGEDGIELWRRPVSAMVDASATIDPANGNIYVSAGSGDVRVVGLNKSGNPLWAQASMLVFDHIDGQNNAQRAQAAGCLSHDGATYYFQTNSQQGDGRLYAINTANGSLKWSYNTHSAGWEFAASSPIVTPNGVIVVGNNEGDAYYAIQDAGNQGVLLDTLPVDPDGTAKASATLSADGRLYLPLRTVQTTGAAGELPTLQVENLFTAVDLTADASAKLWPPSRQRAFARNAAVLLEWEPIVDPTGQFDHYAIYRSNQPFSSVEGMTPVATLHDAQAAEYLVSGLTNGTRYYLAVTTVSLGGGEITEAPSIGPRTPFNQTDLQIVNIARTPRYPRYAPTYSYYLVTEPSGYGPYYFDAATGLGQGQDANTQRFPNVGDPVTYTATVRNRGTNTWTGTLAGRWQVDGGLASQPSQPVSLQPGDIVSFQYVLTWDGASHEVRFTIDVTDARPANNTLAIDTKSVAFLSYIDASRMEEFREETPGYPNAASNDFIDWLNRHMARFNQMFADADCAKRVHFDVLEVLTDGVPDPAIDTIYFAVFPFRYRVGEGTLRSSGYYSPPDDIDFGLLHEMGHQLGLIDLYQLDLPGDLNQVSGMGYSGPACLMLGCSPFLSRHSALAMNHWQDVAHGYFGQYMYQMPAEVRLRILGFDGQPLHGATVKAYQKENRPDLGGIITTQIKYQGTTDANGEYILPNIPINPVQVPPTYAGDQLHDNPFGNLSVVGYNAVLHFRVEYGGGVDYAWLDATDVNIAYWEGQTDTATFERQLALGGGSQTVPPDDMTELNANDWSAWAQGSTTQATYVTDDTGRRIAGGGSVKFITDGGFDTYVSYPRTFTAQWDLSCASELRISFYAENPNFSFQSGSPWIRLKDTDNNYFEYQYYQGGGPTDLLNQAMNQWRSYEIPLNASPTENNGWRRTSSGSPDLARIQYVEIHADTWGGGFTLWLDGVGFDVPGRSLADIDGDCDVDSDDLQAFMGCALGPAIPQNEPGCERARLDDDNDVDQADFAVFQRSIR